MMMTVVVLSVCSVLFSCLTQVYLVFPLCGVGLYHSVLCAGQSCHLARQIGVLRYDT